MLTMTELVSLLKSTRAAGKGRMLSCVFAQYRRARAADARAKLNKDPEQQPAFDELAQIEHEFFVLMRAAYREIKGIDFLDA